ncbi:MAG: hypothetical protein IJO05_02405 [Oscillospiraceae bacterium]|nr:hypothetical protein [Oscillospiraceae bacterium]
MENKHKTKLPGWAVIPIIAVLVAGFLFLPKMEHIADTNGADNFSLATLTEEDILAKSLTCTGGPNRTTGHLSLPGGWEISNGVELSAKKFSGVTDILWADYILPSDFSLSLDHFSVTEGNFRMMVINEGKIIADIQPGDNIDVLIEGLTGYTTVRIAGESAAFTIAMTELQYDLFQHE